MFNTPKVLNYILVSPEFFQRMVNYIYIYIYYTGIWNSHSQTSELLRVQKKCSILEARAPDQIISNQSTGFFQPRNIHIFAPKMSWPFLLHPFVCLRPLADEGDRRKVLVVVLTGTECNQMAWVLGHGMSTTEKGALFVLDEPFCKLKRLKSRCVKIQVAGPANANPDSW